MQGNGGVHRCRVREARSVSPGHIGLSKIVDFICDSYQGDCSLWNSIDVSQDGKLDADELNTYFMSKGFKYEKIPDQIVAPTLQS